VDLLTWVTFVITARSLDPSKDVGSYGYGSVAWKERVESWKLSQGQPGQGSKLQMTTTEGGHLQSSGNGDHHEMGPNGLDLPT
jgi:cellulose synthase A